MSEELDLAAGEAQRGDVQLQQLPVQLDPVPEHNMRPEENRKNLELVRIRKSNLHQVPCRTLFIRFKTNCLTHIRNQEVFELYSRERKR